MSTSTMITEKGETNDTAEILKHVHCFYQDLYANKDHELHNDGTYLTHINNQVDEDDNAYLTKPITLKELTNTLKASKGTTPGPDGIGNQIYKVIWDMHGIIQVKLDCWPPHKGSQ